MLAGTKTGISVIEDDRPWLGAGGSPTDLSTPGAFAVLGIIPGSPAEGRLKPADLITGVENAPAAAGTTTAAGATTDAGNDVTLRLEQFAAGSTVSLKVTRDGQEVRVPVVLGSVIDPSARSVDTQSWYFFTAPTG